MCKFAREKILQWMNSTKSNISTSVCAIKVSKLKISKWEDFQGDQTLKLEPNIHEVGISGANRREDDRQPMAIEINQPLENTEHAYYQFERTVFNQLQDLNMAQNAHHAYCITRFQYLDDQLHNVHDLLFNVYNRDNPKDE